MLQSRNLAGGLAVLLIGSVAAAQPPGGPGGPPGGPGGFPQPGQVLPGFLQDRLNLTAEQKKQLDELQKEVDAKLAKILTTEQKKTLQETRDRFNGPGGFGPFGPGGFGPPGGFGAGFGPAVRLDDVKKQLGASEEEWKVIGPKLQKVAAARQILTAEARALDAGPGSAAANEGRPPAPGDGPRPGPGFGDGPMATSVLSQAQAELRTLLNDPKHSPAEVKEKVAAVRKARQKVRGDLDAAQKDLLQMLTAEQEAVLVGLGYIE